MNGYPLTGRNAFFPAISLCLLFLLPLLSYLSSWVGVINAAIVKAERAGGLMRPPDNGHMLPPLWASCVVCAQWFEVCDKAFVCLGSTSLPLSYSPVKAAGVMARMVKISQL